MFYKNAIKWTYFDATTIRFEKDCTLVLEAKLLTVLARLPDALFMPDRFVNSKYDK